MKVWFSLIAGALALGIEVVVYLALMELPPFGRGASDIIWALPLVGLIVPSLAIPGLLAGIGAMKDPSGGGGGAVIGLFANALSLAIPVLLLVLAVLRVFL